MTYFHKMSVVIFDQQFSGKRSRKRACTGRCADEQDAVATDQPEQGKAEWRRNCGS